MALEFLLASAPFYVFGVFCFAGGVGIGLWLALSGRVSVRPTDPPAKIIQP